MYCVSRSGKPRAGSSAAVDNNDNEAVAVNDDDDTAAAATIEFLLGGKKVYLVFEMFLFNKPSRLLQVVLSHQYSINSLYLFHFRL